MRRPRSPAALVAPGLLLAAWPAAADHGIGLDGAGLAPWTAALLWAAVAFLVGIAVVGIVGVFTRRR